MASSRQVEVDGRELKLTNLDKVLYPKVGFTKGQMVDYYAKVADAMVPHLKGRAVRSAHARLPPPCTGSRPSMFPTAQRCRTGK